jgi:hypothetical protein
MPLRRVSKALVLLVHLILVIKRNGIIHVLISLLILGGESLLLKPESFITYKGCYTIGCRTAGYRPKEAYLVARVNQSKVSSSPGVDSY